MRVGGPGRKERGGRRGRKHFLLYLWVKIPFKGGFVKIVAQLQLRVFSTLRAAKARTENAERSLHFSRGIKCLCKPAAMIDSHTS